MKANRREYVLLETLKLARDIIRALLPMSMASEETVVRALAAIDVVITQADTIRE